MTARTTERIRGEGGKKGESPASEGTKKSVFGRVDSRDKASVLNSRRKSDGGMIEAIVANHFEMLVGDMDNEALNEFHGGNSFDNEFVILMPVVMKSNMRAGVRIDTGSSNNGSAKIATNILGNGRRIAVVRLSINVESLAMILVDVRFDFFERIAELIMESIKQSGTERFAQESIVEVFNAFPRSNASDSDFGNENVNMRIPLQATPKGMKNTDKTRSKMFSLVEFAEHTKNDIANRMKKTIEQRTISAEKDTKLLWDGKNAMSVNTLNDLERHGSGALDGIEISTGRAETAFAAKRNKFERTTRRTPIHGSAISRISAMNHLIDAFKNNRASLKGVLDFFVVI